MSQTFEPTAEQLACSNAQATGQDTRINAYAGTGKALRNDQPVLTPNGYVTIASLRVGDLVIGRDGLPYPVLGTYPQGERAMYALRFSDGSEVIADADHIWTVQRTDHRRAGRFVNRTTAELARKPRTTCGPKSNWGDGTRAYWWLPMCEPVDFGQHVKLAIDPWMLGALLGNASTGGSVVFSTADSDTLDRVTAAAAEQGCNTHYRGQYNYALTVPLPAKGEWGVHNPLVSALRAYGLYGLKSHEKFIPRDYLFASPDARLAILQGLFDTDGYAMGPAVEYVTTSKRLSDDVAFIVHSLGGTITTSEKTPTIDDVPHRLAYRSYVKLPSSVAPFRCERKQAKMAKFPQREPQRALDSVVYVGKAHATCIEVASPDRLFLTANCVVTHNTTTLKYLSRRLRTSATYLAFNKSIADAARAEFPRQVTCSTTHSLAFRDTIRLFDDSKKLTGSVNGGFLAARLGLKDSLLSPTVKMTGRGRGFLICETLKAWQRSDSEDIRAYHVPLAGALKGLPDEMVAGLKASIANDARRVWQMMVDPDNNMPMGHDGYLKLFALSNPRIPGEVLFLDEAQDTNAVVMGIVRNQDSQLICVGDKHQQIYEWRGAKNAMVELPAEIECRLSTSFRFGPSIAGFATRILSLLGETVPLTGNPNRADHVGPLTTKPRAILCRTNARLLEELMHALEAGESPYVVGGTDETKRWLDAAESLKAGVPVDNPIEFFGYADWNAVCAAAETDEGADLKRIVKVIDAHGINGLRKALLQVPRAEDESTLTLSTGHKAKGMEWESVRLADDFLLGVSENDVAKVAAKLEAPDHSPELRLFYVAATRGKTAIEIPPAVMLKLGQLEKLRYALAA